MDNFVIFTGEETEKEFLQKCLEQWEITGNSKLPEMMKMCQLGFMFSEMRHRVDELEG